MPNSDDKNTRIVGQFLTVCSNLRYCYGRYRKKKESPVAISFSLEPGSQDSNQASGPRLLLINRHSARNPRRVPVSG